MSWQRPKSAPFPAVYTHYTGKRVMPNGQFPKFRIQDAPLEMKDEVVDHMVNFFLKAEPMCSLLSFSDDPVSVAELKAMWVDVFHQRMTLIALAEEDDGTTRLAGVNMTGISELKDKDKVYKFDGVPMQHVLGVVTHMTDMVNVFERYGVTEYLTAMGLSIIPEYQGQGLGLEILLARVPLCRATGVRLTSTVFTASNSQELARRAGFETIAETEYAEFKKDGKEVFQGIKTKTLKTMTLAIEEQT